MAFSKILRTVVVSVGASLLAAQANAIVISDATIQNATGDLDSSIATVMGQGKIKNANVNAFTGLFAGDEWSLLDRTNKSSKTFNDVDFLLSADTGQRSGEWGLDWTGSDVPAYMDYVLVLKSGRQWGAFLFESVSLTPDVQDLAGTFKISWRNKKGKIPKLRHASIFGRAGVAPAGSNGSTSGSISVNGTPSGPSWLDDGTGGPGDGTDGPGDGTDGPGDGTDGPGDGTDGDGKDGTGGPGSNVSLVANDVPAPGSLALLAMGLGLVLMQLRQRNRS